MHRLARDRKLGNQPSPTANTRISKMPIRKVGSETPSSDSVMKTWLMNEPRRKAAYTPIGMPQCQRQHGSKGQLQRGRKALGNQARHLGTLAQAQAELPCTALDRKCQNCTKKGLSSPRSARRARICSGVASCPSKEYDRVTHVLKQQERDEGHRGHDDHGLKQAAQDKGEHGL
jgi:hypothetical protein